MRVARISAVATVCMLFLAPTLFAQALIPPSNYLDGPPKEYAGHVAVVWDKATGELWVCTTNSDNAGLSGITLEVDPSATEFRFNPGPPDAHGIGENCAFDKGFFNVCSDTKIAHILFGQGVGATPNCFLLGTNLIPEDTDPAVLQAALKVSGAHHPNGDLLKYQNESTTGLTGPVFLGIPEPSTLVLFGVGLLGLIGLRRRL